MPPIIHWQIGALKVAIRGEARQKMRHNRTADAIKACREHGSELGD